MSEESAIKAVDSPNTIDSLTKGLYELGVREGDTVMVHSSMNKLGWICGAETALIQALINAVGDSGTVCMPAHSGALSDPEVWCCPPVPTDWVPIIRETMPAYDAENTPTRAVGRVAECFRKWTGARRSCHPQVSVAALGARAEEITREHPLSPMFGMESPYGKLYKMNAKILLLGVDYSNCTLLHTAEALADNPPTERMGAPVIKDGKREWVWFEDVQTDNERFPAIGEAYENAGGKVTRVKIGNADCMALPARELIDFGIRWLNEYAAPPYK